MFFDFVNNPTVEPHATCMSEMSVVFVTPTDDAESLAPLPATRAPTDSPSQTASTISSGIPTLARLTNDDETSGVLKVVPLALLSVSSVLAMWLLLL